MIVFSKVSWATDLEKLTYNYVDEAVPPVVLPARKVPVALNSKVQTELNQL